MSKIKVLKGEGDLQFPKKTVKIQKVAVGCSGGVDSTALFHLLCGFFKEKKKSQLAILHINFGLRGEESQKDESYLRRLSRKFGVEIFVRNVNPGQTPKTGVQAWARNLRYSFFEEYIDAPMARPNAMPKPTMPVANPNATPIAIPAPSIFVCFFINLSHF